MSHFEREASSCAQGFLGHVIARECSQEACRDGEARSGVGGGGGSPEGPLGAAVGDDVRPGASARTVLRLRRGEDLESVSRELGVTAARAAQWRDRFLVAGQAGRTSRATEAVDEDSRRLQAKVGERLMENEWLDATVDHLKAGGPWARRRSTR